MANTGGDVAVVESLKSRMARWSFNWFPCYWGTGARITYIAADWCEIRLKLPLALRTRNYVGTIFGGSMYGAVDPIYMIMLLHVLGRDYVVWDKSASIRFLRPGRGTLTARCHLDAAELSAIRTALQTVRSVDRVYHIALTDSMGTVCAEIEKTVYVRRKDAAPTPTTQVSEASLDAV